MIILTGKVMQHVFRYLTRRDRGMGLCVGVKTMGCSGPAYELEYADETITEDQAFESSDVRAIVDPESLPYIDGTKLDYIREGLNEGLRFNNSNVRDGCGYGGSFRM